MQPAEFARTYATYGGIFLVLTLLFAWKFDGFRPDKYDVVGAVIVLTGAYIMFYAPRKVV